MNPYSILREKTHKTMKKHFSFWKIEPSKLFFKKLKQIRLDLLLSSKKKKKKKNRASVCKKHSAPHISSP